MKYPEFVKAKTIEKACQYLKNNGGNLKILAGGTDLMVAINKRHILPDMILYIGELDLNYVREVNDTIIIGAMTTHDSITKSKLLKEKLPLLVEAVSSIGSPAVRNMGTIGGNIANASPAADSVPALLALNAKLKLVSKGNERVVNLDGFFTGPGKTIIRNDEILKEIIIPVPEKETLWGWKKLGQRKAEICSIISVAILLKKKSDICDEIKICLGSVAPTAMCAVESQKVAKGAKLTKELIGKVGLAISEEIRPIDDVRATAWYRKKVSAGIIRNMLSDLAS